MSWVEMDEAGWSWVHGLVIPKSKNCFNVKSSTRSSSTSSASSGDEDIGRFSNLH